jgi:hypothetical protein
VLNWGEPKPCKEEVEEGVEVWGLCIKKRQIVGKLREVTCNAIVGI